MKKWNELTMSERAEAIRVAVKNDITDLGSIRDKYNEFAEGGNIHIDPSKKGTFTAAASKHGKSVQEFASQVLAHPENYSPAMRKKANFAKNASHWKHGDGGNIYEGGGLFGNDTIDTIASFLPIVGTMEDAYTFYKDPSLANAGWLAASLASDVFTGGMASRAIKAVKVANKAVDTANATTKAARRTWKTNKLANVTGQNGPNTRRSIEAVKAAGDSRNAAIRRANDALFGAGIKIGIDQELNGFLNATQLDMLPNLAR